MHKDLAQQAVSQALSGNWEEALKTNKKILSKDPKDIEALNRLARAYAELGHLKKACATAQKVLKIDPFNPIAQKALAKWETLKKESSTYTSSLVGAEAFLEEPGKTKVVNLIHTGSPKVLAKLDSGDEVKFSTHPHRISVVTTDGKFIGKLPDDLSARLKRLLSLGNSYQVFIKSISKNDVKVLIREVRRAKRLANFPSFPPEKIDYISFTPPELVHKKEENEDIPEEEV